MSIQKTHWGQIQWLHTRNEQVPNQSINVGLSRIECGKKQNSHIHYGEEQFIYILAGTGKHVVDGETHVLGAGAGMYLKPGVVHEMENIGNEPIQELIFSNPVSFLQKFSSDLADPAESEENSEVFPDLSLAVEALKPKLRDTFAAPYAIFDKKWHLLLQNDRYPEFCVQTCAPCINQNDTMCLALPAESSCTEDEQTWFICPYGLVIYQLPLVYRGVVLGWVRGGHIMQTILTGEVKIATMYDRPQSAAIGIQNLLRQLCKALLAYCDFDQARREIERKNKLLETAETQKKDLERNLRLSEDRATGLQINRHFLFNTLNCMADMALKKRGHSLYRAIVSLAEMLHYTAQRVKPFVCLQQEAAHVENYLNLQKLRLDGKLTTTKSIPEDLLHCYVPIDFIQPIVENCFVHGFKNYLGDKEIGIRVEHRHNARLSILVCNNGVLPAPHEVEKINRYIASGSGHGLSLIFTKLKIIYGNDFTMQMFLDASQYTGVVVEIPVRFKEFFHD